MGENLDDLTSNCVHCGFCLPACPTYALTGDENDSPRGRIHLMRQVLEGKAELDDAVAEHVDSCLGCLSCVSACPSGVRVRQDHRGVPPRGRARLRRAPRRQGLPASSCSALFPHPARLRVAALGAVAYRRTGGAALVRSSGLLRRFPKLGAMEALMPETTLRKAWSTMPADTRPRGEQRATVGLLSGCVQRVFFGDVNAATARVLQAEGCRVVVPDQGCCGALSLHAGRDEEARRYARRLIDAFRRPPSSAAVPLSELDAIVVNVAGCGSTLKQYGELLADDPDYAEPAAEFAAKVRDVSEVLADLEPRAERHPIQARVAYHDACHLAHGQGVRAQPRKLLGDIPGLRGGRAGRGRLLLRLGGSAQPGAARGGRGTGPAQGRADPRDRAGPGRHREPRLPAADPAAPRETTRRWCTRSRSSTPRSGD